MDILGALGALAAFVVPMVLAGWLLGRPDRRRRPRDKPRGKMPSSKED